MKKSPILITLGIALMLTELCAWIVSIVYFVTQSFTFMPYYTPAGTVFSLIISLSFVSLDVLPSFNDIPLIIKIIYSIFCAAVVPICILLIRIQRIVCAIDCIKGKNNMLTLTQIGIWISIVFNVIVFAFIRFNAEAFDIVLSVIPFALPTVIYAVLLIMIGKAKN